MHYLPTHLLCDVRYQPSVLPTRYPVVTSQMGPDGLFGGDDGGGGGVTNDSLVSAYELAMQCPRMVRYRPISLLRDVRYYHSVCFNAYDVAMRCPVLTYRIVLPGFRSRQLSDAGRLPAYALAMRCPVLTSRTVRYLPMSLLLNVRSVWCYQIEALQDDHSKQVNSAISLQCMVLSPYALAVRCP
eukprot:3912358-Rhodomonas_salina.1